MPRRKKLPPDYNPNRVACGPQRGARHVCPHCLGVTRVTKGSTLDQAIVIHEATCPAIHRIKPTTKGKG